MGPEATRITSNKDVTLNTSGESRTQRRRRQRQWAQGRAEASTPFDWCAAVAEALPVCASVLEEATAYSLALPVVIAGVPLRALGDTGASVSVVRADVAERLGLHVRQGETRCVSAAGEVFVAHGTAAAVVELGGARLPVTFIVTDSLAHEVILGVDALGGADVASEWLFDGRGGVSISFDGGEPVHTALSLGSSFRGFDMATIQLDGGQHLVAEGDFGGALATEDEVVRAVVAALHVPDLSPGEPAIGPEEDDDDDREDDRHAWKGCVVSASLKPATRRSLEALLRERWRRFTLRDVPPIMRGICHRVTLRDDADVESAVDPMRRFSPEKLEAIKTMVTGLAGKRRLVQVPSLGQAVPVVVTKKDDAGRVKGYRVALDFRKLNTLSFQQAYPLPRIDDITAGLARFARRSKLDAKACYFAIPLDEESVRLTGTLFGPGLRYCWRVAPFGLAGLPQTLQEAMDKTFNVLPGVFAYMDDVMVGHQSEATLVDDVRRVLDAADELGMCFSPSKCEFGAETIQALGFDVGPDSVKPAEKRTAVLAEWPQPRSAKGLKSFLAMARHYLAHLPAFQEQAKPLEALVRGKSTEKFAARWQPEHSIAFAAVKASFAEAISLAPLGDGRVRITTDFSSYGFGFILEEEREEGWRIVAAGSKATNKYEAKYGPMDGEIAALRAAVRKFRHLGLEGREVLWVTDNKPAAASLTTNHRSNDRIRRTAVELSPFNIKPSWMPGSEIPADALSRLQEFVPAGAVAQGPDDQEGAGEGFFEVDGKGQTEGGRREREGGEGVRRPPRKLHAAVSFVAPLPPHPSPPDPSHPTDPPLPDAIPTAAAANDGTLTDAADDGPIAEFSVPAELCEQWRKEQDEEPDFANAEQLGATRGEDGLLRSAKGALLVPKPRRERVMKALHNEHLHQGAATMLRVGQRWVHWHGMRSDLTKWAQECVNCQLTQHRRGAAALGRIGHQRERFVEWHLDLAFVPADDGGEELIVFTAQEDATGFLVNIPLPNREAATVLAAFHQGVYHRSGRLIRTVRLDQGSEFQGLFRQALQGLNLEVKETPAGDNNSIGRLERSHGPLKGAIRRRRLEFPGTTAASHLADVTAAMNATPAPGAMVSPWEALHGERAQPAPALTWLIRAQLMRGDEPSDLAWKAGVAGDAAAVDLARLRDAQSASRVGKREADPSTEAPWQVGEVVHFLPGGGASVGSEAISFGPYFVARVDAGGQAADLAPATQPWEMILGLSDADRKARGDWVFKAATKFLFRWRGTLTVGETAVRLTKQGRKWVESQERRTTEALEDEKRKEDAKKQADSRKQLAQIAKQEKVLLGELRSQKAELNKLPAAQKRARQSEVDAIESKIARAKRVKKRGADR